MAKKVKQKIQLVEGVDIDYYPYEQYYTASEKRLDMAYTKSKCPQLNLLNSI